MNIYGGIREFFGKPMRDSDRGKYKKMSFTQAFARSSNVAFSSIVFDNYAGKPSKYISHLRNLNLDKITGLEIMGEPKPFLNHPQSSSWSRLTLPWLAIGYENQHTPLQLLTAYNGIINDGLLVSPSIVRKVTDAGIVVLDKEKGKKTKRVCSKATSDKIKKLTAAVFTEGSARNVRSAVVALAGKTGTAQIATKGAYQTTKKYNASFVGHFPALKPVYSVYVMVNEPRNGAYYASYVAAPVFSEVAEKIFTISVKKEVDESKNMPPAYLAGYYTDFKDLNSTLGVTISEEVNSDVVRIDAANNRAVGISSASGKMPKLVGLSAKDAVHLAELNGLKAKVNGYGRVREQSPRAGARVSKNQTIYIRLN